MARREDLRRLRDGSAAMYLVTRSTFVAFRGRNTSGQRTINYVLETVEWLGIFERVVKNVRKILQSLLETVVLITVPFVSNLRYVSEK